MMEGIVYSPWDHNQNLGRNYLICLAFLLLLQAKRSKSLLTFTRNLPSAPLTILRCVLRISTWIADWFCAKVALFEIGILNFQSGFLVSEAPTGRYQANNGHRPL